MGILAWIIVGGAAGWLASVVVQGTGMGLLYDILLGIVGALLGSWLAALLGVGTFTGFNFLSLIIAFVGSLVVLVIVKEIRIRSGTTPRF